MGKKRKKNKEAKKPKQKNFHRRAHTYFHYKPKSIVLDGELKQLKRDIDLIDLDSKTFDEAAINDRWSANVLAFSDSFIDTDNLIPIKNTFEGPADIHLNNWDDFIQKFWDSLVVLVHEPIRIDYFITFINSKSNDAWQMANDTNEKIPDKYTIAGGPADILYDQLLGNMRISHIWRDQLLWACEFLKIEMP